MIIRQTCSNDEDWSNWFTNNFIVYIGTEQTSRSKDGLIDFYKGEDSYYDEDRTSDEYKTFIYNDEENK